MVILSASKYLRSLLKNKNFMNSKLFRIPPKMNSEKISHKMLIIKMNKKNKLLLIKNYRRISNLKENNISICRVSKILLRILLILSYKILCKEEHRRPI